MRVAKEWEKRGRRELEKWVGVRRGNWWRDLDSAVAVVVVVVVVAETKRGLSLTTKEKKAEGGGSSGDGCGGGGRRRWWSICVDAAMFSRRLRFSCPRKN